MTSNRQQLALFKFNLYLLYTLGHAVEQLVKALRYTPEGRVFDSRWTQWNFSVAQSFRPQYDPAVESD